MTSATTALHHYSSTSLHQWTNSYWASIGVYVPADIYARYLRMKGEDVFFVCGSDEHGVAISIKAKKEGKTPKEIIDYYHNMIQSSLMILEFLLIIMEGLPIRFIIKLQVIFLKHFMKRVILLKRPQSNCTIKKPNNFWLIGL